MRILHSFWSKPAFHSNQSYDNSRKFGGWMDYRYFLLSQMFSCLSFRKHHGRIELFTDQVGYDLFINDLNLPYDTVSLMLDDLEECDHRLWALGKLKVLSSQNSPFLHVDNDVYVWEAIPKFTRDDFLLVQSRIHTPAVYVRTLQQIIEVFEYVPPFLNVKQEQIANIGIIGGNNIDFFAEFCEISYALLNECFQKIDLIDVGRFNQILDEYLFSSFCNFKGKELTYLVDSSNESTPLSSVLRYNLVPIIDKYIHLVGIAKQNILACEQLEIRSKLEYPKYYLKILDLLDSSNCNTYFNEKLNLNSRINALKIIYKSSINDILKLKFIIKDISFLNIYNLTSAAYSETYSAPYNDSVRSPHISNHDVLYKYFESPTCILDILDNFLSLRVGFSEIDLLQFKLLDWVLEKVVVEGTLVISEA